MMDLEIVHCTSIRLVAIHIHSRNVILTCDCQDKCDAVALHWKLLWGCQMSLSLTPSIRLSLMLIDISSMLSSQQLANLENQTTSEEQVIA